MDICIEEMNQGTIDMVYDIVGEFLDIDAHALYQIKNGNLVKVCDFYTPVIPNISKYGNYNIIIGLLTDSEIVTESKNQFGGTGWLQWETVYQYKSGKWKVKGNTYKVTDSVAKTMTQKDIWTLKRNLTLYKTPGGKSKAFTLKKGTKLKIKKICLKNKHTYMQVTTVKGKKAWFQAPKKEVAYFEETIYAG